MITNCLNVVKCIVGASITRSFPSAASLARCNQPMFTQCLHSSANNFGKTDDKSYLIRQIPKKDEGTDGAMTFDLDKVSDDQFVNTSTPNMLFDGVPFKLLPIVNIRTSPNNTIFTITDYQGKVHHLYSCGLEGYKNCRKGTNVAAQATGITFAKKCLKDGFKTVRLKIRGLGPGRLSSVRGLEMAGMNIISVTDFTRVSWDPPRPRKARRI